MRKGHHAAFAPSSESRSRLRHSLRRLIGRSRTGSIRKIIGKAVVPLLRGWTRYFGLTEDPRVWSEIGRMVEGEIWRWTRRQAHAVHTPPRSNHEQNITLSTFEWERAVRIASREFGLYESPRSTESFREPRESETVQMTIELRRRLGLPALPSEKASSHTSPQADIRGGPAARD